MIDSILKLAMPHYKIQAINPNAHLFEITLTIDKPDPKGQICRLPNWIPGSYMIRDFSKHIQWLKAESAGIEVAITKLDKSSWQFAPCDGALIITYQVYAWDLSVRGAHLDQTHGFFNGPSVFLSVEGQEQAECKLEIVKPQGETYQNWKLATGLDTDKGTQEFAFGHYKAANYDELIDCPVEMANFTLISFDACGVPHHLVLVGQHKADEARLKRDLTAICEHHINFFGTPAPMKRYLFMTYVLAKGFGGLEHRNSTALHCSRSDLPQKTDPQDKVKEDYQTFLDLCSHEYFHSWNIKRIKPTVFLPYSTQQESYTELLWAFEGITSYYDSLALAQAGVISIEDYLTRLAKSITAVRRAKGRLVQSVTESSFDAWNKFYKQDENALNAVVSYYTKGAVIALCLDLLIRQKTEDKSSLQDVMRILWQNYGLKNDGISGCGIENSTIQNIVYQLCGYAHKSSLEDFFKLALYSTQELPLAELLKSVGLTLNYQARSSRKDRGSFKKSFKVIETKASLGIEFVSSNKLMVRNVYLDSAASKAGISAGDELIAVDGLKVSSSTFDQLIEAFTIGDSIEVHLFRRDELIVLNVKLEPAEADTAYLSYSEQTGPVQSMLNWLNR